MPQRVRSSSPRSASLIVALVIATGTLAQNIGINSDGAAAHASALLDVSVAALPANAKKGLLVPRMTTAQRNAIPTPAEALLVYDTSLNQFWYYDGVQWAAIANLGNLWSTTGNVGTLVIHSIGTTAGSTTMEFRVNDQRAAYMADAVTRTSFGHGAMPVATGTNSSAFGKDALQSLTSGNNNTALGASALRNLTTAGSNTAIGFEALHMNTGGRNTAVGYRALTANTTGTDNTAVGYLALSSNLTGNFNTAVGFQTLRYNTASSNTAVGWNALRDNTSGSSNTAVGMRCLANNLTGNQNSGMGFECLQVNTSGSGNSAIGHQALQANSSGLYNVAFGKDALGASTASFNTAAGMLSGDGITSGSYNTALGYNALPSTTTASNNSAAGAFAGIGGNFTNTTAIGAGAFPTASNRINIGTALSNNLTGGYGSWQNFSDARFKRDVQADVPGLDFILRLRPVSYLLDAEATERRSGNWQRMDSCTVKDHRASYMQRIAEVSAERQTGFIAQEVESAARAIGYDFDGVHVPVDSSDLYALGYDLFTLPLIQAAKEQEAIIVELEAINAQLQRRVAEVEAGIVPTPKLP